MKKILLATAAFGALTVSVPASAQVGDILRQGIETIFGGNSYNSYNGSITQGQLSELNVRIQAGYRNGQISQSEASRFQNELRLIAQREQAYSSGGFTRAERADLQRRLQVLDSRIQQAGYGNGNWNDRNDRDDRNWNGRYDRDDDDDDDRYDRRDRDRDDRYGRDGRWSDNDRNNGRWSDNDRRNGRSWCPPGLERKNNGCQPPGQAKKGDRWSNQYDQAAAGFGQRYRDTNRFLYRYNDGRIYQIDRRTNRVVNVTMAPRRR